MGKNKAKENGTGRRRSSGSRNGPIKASGIIREFSSGGIVFKRESSNIVWLIRSSTPNRWFPKSSWGFPKGWIDDGDGEGIPGPMASGSVKADEDSLQMAAVREVWEEGGVSAKIVEKIGTTKYSYNNPDRGYIFKFVTYYLMEYINDNPDGHDNETAEINWLPFDQALKKLSFSGDKQMFKKAMVLLDRLI